MAEGSSKIRRIRLRLRQWRKNAGHGLWSDVPSGHIAVTVGPSCKRFVVPTTYLNHPLFEKLLLQAEEEYGFVNSGPLAIPCPEDLFEYILRCMARTHQPLTCSVNPHVFRSCCHLGFERMVDISSDSLPLMHGSTQLKPIW